MPSDKVKLGYTYNVRSPQAEKWIKDHSTELIDDISKTTREELREVLLDAFEHGSIETLRRDITHIMGDEERADLIARTETMFAANVGQQDAWAQAANKGYLNGDELQVWIVTPDDRLCPECEALEDATAPLGKPFDKGVYGPPLHPRCRCTLGMTLKGR